MGVARYRESGMEFGDIVQQIETWVAEDAVRGAAIEVEHRGTVVARHFAGEAQDGVPVDEQTLQVRSQPAEATGTRLTRPRGGGQRMNSPRSRRRLTRWPPDAAPAAPACPTPSAAAGCTTARPWRGRRSS